ncbi:MAG: CoA-binding protein [Bacteroidetes bacterium]|nr:CoA-binding protein [Bacteroidota bacterium]
MNESKKTLVLGASTNPARYSYVAINDLRNSGHEVVAIGLREGEVADVHIEKPASPKKDIHTITLYLNPKRQEEYYDYILQTRPERIIFNPGTENPELAALARKEGIETQAACTLVMLSLKSY